MDKTAPGEGRGSARSSGRLGGTLFVRVALVLLAGAVAVGAPRVTHLDIGGPYDAGWVAGFWEPEPLGGTTVRWTAGDGVIRFPYVGPFPATARLRLAPHPERPDDPVQVIVNQLDTTQLTLTSEPASAFRTYEVSMRRPQGDGRVTLILRSAVTRAGSEPRPRGVAVDGVEFVTGGLRALWPPSGLVLWTVLILATVMFWPSRRDRDAARSPGPGLQQTVWVLAAMVGFVGLRFALPPVLPLVAVACVLAYVARLAVPSWFDERLAETWGRLLDRRGVWIFLGLCLLLVFGGLFGGALVRGHVLSQADILFDFFPWRAYEPEGHRVGNPLLGDVPMQFYPFYVQAAKAVRSGELPLWSTTMFAGHPFLASFQTAVFSPFTVLAYVLPLPAATVWIAAARLLVGGIGMFVFVRSLGLRWAAAACAGVAFLLNPFTIVWLEHPHAAAAAWLPWLLWSTHRTIHDGRWRSVAMLAGITGVALLAGHPETTLKSVLLSGGYGLTMTFVHRRRRALGALVIGYAGGLLLSAIQVLPFLEYLFLSRALTDRSGFELNPYVVPLRTMVTAVVPNFYGNPAHGTALDVGANFNERLVYAGVVVWLLAAVGVTAWWRDARVRFLAGAAIVAGAMMYGAPGVHELASSLPVLNVTALSRFGLVVIATVATLAAFGMEALLAGRPGESSAGSALARTSLSEPSRGTSRRLWVPAAVGMLVAAALVAGFLVAGPSIGGVRYAQFGLFYSGLAIGFALVGCVAIVLRVGAHVSGPAFVLTVIALVAVELLVFARGYHPFVPPARVFPVLPEIRALQDDPDLFRVAGWGNTLLPNGAAVYGLQDFRGYDALVPARYGELLDAAFDFDGSFHHATHFVEPRLLDLLNVKYVFVRPGMELPADHFTRMNVGSAPLYRNERAFPRTFLVDRYQVENGNPARRILRDGRVDLRRVVLLEADLMDDERPETTADADAVGRATVERYGNSRVEIETSAPGRRLLVLTDIHYPGWQATVDGEEVPIHRANFAFRAVSVPPGTHRVRFDYRPASFRLGAGISGVTLVVLAGAVLAGRRRRGHGSAATQLPSSSHFFRSCSTTPVTSKALR